MAKKEKWINLEEYEKPNLKRAYEALARKKTLEKLKKIKIPGESE